MIIYYLLYIFFVIIFIKLSQLDNLILFLIVLRVALFLLYG